MIQHAGNAANQMQFEEHDGVNNAKRVTLALGGAGLTSLPTLYAVVNTSSGGAVTVTPVGLSTLASSPNYIGLATVVPGSNVTLNASSAFIGITTIANQPALVASSAYIGLVTVGGIGTLTLADPKGFIGLTTLGGGFSAIVDGADTVMKLSVASVADGKYLMAGIRSNSTVLLGNQPPLTAGVAGIGFATVAIGTNVNTNIGLVTIAGGAAWADPKTYIGLITVGGIGTLTLADPKGFIGLTTLGGGFSAIADGVDTVMKVSVASVADGKYLMAGIRSNSTVLLGNQPALTAGAAYIGLVTVDIGTQNGVAVKGNVTLSDAKTNIGLVTLSGGTAWTDPKTYIGLVTITGSLSAAAGNVTLDPGSITQIRDGADGVMKLSIASVADGTYLSVRTRGNSTIVVGNIPAVTVNAGAAYIGLVTVGGIGTLTLADPKGYIGLATTTNGVGDRFIGLVTVVTSGNITVLTRNAGTNKTLLTLPITLSTGSIATIVIPTNAQAIYITHLMLNSNATVRLNVKSGVTYLTGNASLGINIFPGGGLVQDGSADSPVYLGNASGGLFIEKADSGGVISQIGGMVTYFQE